VFEISGFRVALVAEDKIWKKAHGTGT